MSCKHGVLLMKDVCVSPIKVIYQIDTICGYFINSIYNIIYYYHIHAFFVHSDVLLSTAGFHYWTANDHSLKVENII